MLRRKSKRYYAQIKRRVSRIVREVDVDSHGVTYFDGKNVGVHVLPQVFAQTMLLPVDDVQRLVQPLLDSAHSQEATAAAGA